MKLTEATLSLRKDAEMSQRDFAQLLGIGFSAVQKYEAGRFHEPDPRIMVAFMASAMDQSRSDLAAVFERELIAGLNPPPGFSVEVTVKRTTKERRHEARD